MYTCYKVIRSFIRGAFDWELIFESESDLRVRHTVRRGPGVRVTAQRSREDELEVRGPDHTENHSDHPAAACTAGRPHTRTQSCAGRVWHFGGERKRLEVNRGKPWQI